MKISKYKNLYQITYLPTMFPINCFVIEQEQKLLVIDMGVRPFADQVKKISEQTGKKVSHLLLTHAHADHVNGVPHFRQLFPDVSIGISKRDSLLLTGDFELKKGESQKKIKGGFPNTQIPFDFTMEDKEQIEGISVVESPGHTPGSISFYEPNHQLLIVGDAFQIRGGLAVSGTLNLLFPFPKFATWDEDKALNSAKRLTAFQPKLLAVGHGNMRQEPQQAMQQAIQKAESRKSS
ncbi:MBL fold metallo-hydrolase [Gracilibacillus alcaliphilus]|uniref:MBL fold metallo-hydrolase n=1 Tax=Gracilibacillus alcaliphilus TaxID=1401441 RepID=UPI00195AE137|nr:MBL fold metallo-hydrolase [Gracilibacillus alcaliphilus]MBM7679160.1 glyoxylase-like metal-dependent hydrolase (beta-lactamase superfamily II) [Gracilibacillus alcaliphilus]